MLQDQSNILDLVGGAQTNTPNVLRLHYMSLRAVFSRLHYKAHNLHWFLSLIKSHVAWVCYG